MSDRKRLPTREYPTDEQLPTEWRQEPAINGSIHICGVLSRPWNLSFWLDHYYHGAELVLLGQEWMEPVIIPRIIFGILSVFWAFGPSPFPFSRDRIDYSRFDLI